MELTAIQAQYQKLLTIHAAPDVVFKTFTNPKDILHWYGAIAQLALRTSGHFTYADAEGDVYESGEFLHVKANESLKYKMEHHGFYKGSEVTITLRTSNHQTTEFELVHTHLGKSDLQHVSANWDWALNNFKNFLENGTTQTFKAWFKLNQQNYEM